LLLLVGLELLLIDSVSQAIVENLTPLPSLLEDAIILLFPSFNLEETWDYNLAIQVEKFIELLLFL
jgi:hypothetical protein